MNCVIIMGALHVNYTIVLFQLSLGEREGERERKKLFFVQQ